MLSRTRGILQLGTWLKPMPSHIDGKPQRGYLIDAQGVRLPSVTTILNATRPQAAREDLMRWRDRLGTTEAGRISAAASRRGSMTHKQVKTYLAGENPVCPEAIRPYWESLEPVLSDVQDVSLLEKTVFHYDLGYAGKVDCVATYQGVPCVIDWKTADQPKGSIERLYDGPLQLAAYCGAVNHSYPDQSAALRQAILVVAIPHLPAEIFRFEPEAMAQLWQAWQTRVDQFYSRRHKR